MDIDTAEDDIMELLWQDGNVVVHSQTHRSMQKSQSSKPPLEQAPAPPQPPPQPPQAAEQSQLFIAEDEMATWLHYPFEDFYADLLSTPPPQPQPPPVQSTTAAARAPPLPQKPPVAPQSGTKNFLLFSKMRGRGTEASTELTVVDSNDTPSSGQISAAPPSVAVGVDFQVGGGGGGGTLRRCGGSGETVTSSLSGSGSGDTASETATGTAVECGEMVVGKRLLEDRKRKRVDTEDEATATRTGCHAQDVENESADEKKAARGSTATKRSRAAEVHNLSERKRRDRINERMRALQELIPRCNKSDKASMLDEAIEYLKSLQMQVQMMSMGCGMVPMMYPGMQQQCMPPVGMGMGMGIGMGMDMGMNHPMIPFPSTVPGSALQTNPAGSVLPTSPAAAGPPQLGTKLPVPAFSVPPGPGPSLSVMQTSNQADSIQGSFPLQSTGLPQLPNMSDPYQQYVALQQMQMQMQVQMQMQMQLQMQNQSIQQPGSSKPSTRKNEGHHDNS